MVIKVSPNPLVLIKKVATGCNAVLTMSSMQGTASSGLNIWKKYEAGFTKLKQAQRT